jgi:predicted aspartyl protease
MKIKIPIQIVELEDDNYHLIITSVFSDGTKEYWAVDTGASKTVFDKNKKERYSVSDEKTDQVHTAGISEKPLETTIAYLHPLSIGKVKLQKLKVALLDMSHINNLYSKAAHLKICGLLGGDFLMKYKACIDYKDKIMILRKK